MSENGYKKLRLVKVIIQPVFVIDDGESLEEKVTQPITVSASEWPDYPRKMATEIDQTERELNSAAG